MIIKKYLFRFFILLFLNCAGFVFGMKAPVAALRPIDKVFLLACKKNTDINFALKNGANPDSIDPENGYTGLHYACMNGNLDRVKWFLKYDWDLLNIQGKDGSDPVEVASEYKHIPIEQYLIDSQLIFLSKNFSGPFFVSTATDLLQRGGNINAKADDVIESAQELIGFTPLLYACIDAEPEKVKFLLAHGADANQKSAVGLFPLYIIFSSAVGGKNESKRFEMTKLLLEHGADLRLMGPRHHGILAAAVRSNSPRCINLLLNKDIDVNVVDDEGQTPLHWAAEQAGVEVIKALLDAGANINAVDNNGKTPVMLAAKNPHKQSLTYLQKESRKPVSAQKNMPAIDQPALSQKKVTEKVTEEQATKSSKKNEQSKKKKKKKKPVTQKKEPVTPIQAGEIKSEESLLLEMEKEALARTEEYRQKLHDLEEENRKRIEAQEKAKQSEVAPLETEPAPIEQSAQQTHVPQLSKIKKPKKSLMERAQEKAVKVFITPETKQSFADVAAAKLEKKAQKAEGEKITYGNLQVTLPAGQRRLMLTGHQENPLAKIRQYTKHVEDKRNDPNDPFHSFPPDVENELGYLAKAKLLQQETKEHPAITEYTIPASVSFVGGKNIFPGEFEFMVESKEGQVPKMSHRVFIPSEKISKKKKQLMLPAPTGDKGGTELPK